MVTTKIYRKIFRHTIAIYLLTLLGKNEKANISMEENDYSLNILRYVDTFEEEQPVDIDAVAAELKALETDMRKTDATIAGFVRSLGLAARPLSGVEGE